LALFGEWKTSNGYPAEFYPQRCSRHCGNIYVPDPDNHVVLKINSNNIVTVIAGNGIWGYSGDGGPATSASLNTPQAVALDSIGNLFIADGFNYRIRKVTPDGIISTVATTAKFDFITDLVADGTGNLYAVDAVNDCVWRIGRDGASTRVVGNGQAGYSGDGGPATSATLNGPSALTFDRAGNLYVADYGNNRIRRVGLDGIISTVAGNGTYGFSGDGGLATNARLARPYGVAVDIDRNLYIGDTGNNRIRVVNPQGIISTVAGDGFQRFFGDGSSPLKVSFFFPRGLAFDDQGNLLVADEGNLRIRRIALGVSVTTLAGNGRFRETPDGTAATKAYLFAPQGIAFDRAGSLYISDTANDLIRKLNADGSVQRVAGTGVRSVGGDNKPARDAGLNIPRGIAFAPNGEVFYVNVLRGTSESAARLHARTYRAVSRCDRRIGLLSCHAL
jgi:sugar lactone lactonase YvrE